MSRIIRADEMAKHINRLREALSLMQRPASVRTPEDYGRARGLLSYTIDALVRSSIADVVIEDIAP